MCRIRSDRCKKRKDSVRGIQRIALRGPGCIDGTGQCQGVLGTGRKICCEEVLGTGGRRSENVFGTGRRFKPCKHSDNWLWNDLETPTTVPR